VPQAPKLDLPPDPQYVTLSVCSFAEHYLRHLHCTKRTLKGREADMGKKFGLQISAVQGVVRDCTQGARGHLETNL